MIFQINQKYKKPNKSDVLEFQKTSVSMISDSMRNLNSMNNKLSEASAPPDADENVEEYTYIWS